MQQELLSKSPHTGFPGLQHRSLREPKQTTAFGFTALEETVKISQLALNLPPALGRKDEAAKGLFQLSAESGFQLQHLRQSKK